MEKLESIDPLKIVVTGISGFVGQHFCTRYGGISLADSEGAVDLRDTRRVSSTIAMLAPQAVLHLAAQSSVAASFRDPLETLQVNFLGTMNLLRALSAIKFSGVLVFVSSADVYGKLDDRDLPANEGQALRPRSPYAVSKVAAEALCYQWSQTESYRIVTARPFNQIGPKQSERFAIADFARQIVEIRRGQRSPILVTGDIDITRDFTDVRDAIAAYYLLLRGGKSGESYNICSGRECSLRALLVEMMQIAGVAAELRVDPARLRPAEQRRMAGDYTKIREQLGWTPKISTAETLTDILNEVEKI